MLIRRWKTWCLFSFVATCYWCYFIQMFLSVLRRSFSSSIRSFTGTYTVTLERGMQKHSSSLKLRRAFGKASCCSTEAAWHPSDGSSTDVSLLCKAAKAVSDEKLFVATQHFCNRRICWNFTFLYAFPGSHSIPPPLLLDLIIGCTFHPVFSTHVGLFCDNAVLMLLLCLGT